MKEIMQNILEDGDVATIAAPESEPMGEASPLRNLVKQSLQRYFKQLDGQLPSNLYNLVLPEFEKPLLEKVLEITNQNQSKAAKVLGISRGTLRKKMAIYSLF